MEQFTEYFTIIKEYFAGHPHMVWIVSAAAVLLIALGVFLLVLWWKKPWFKQIRNFVIVGGTSFLIDYILLFVFTEYLGIWYLLSAALSFVTSTVFNYIASMAIVFKGRAGRGKVNEFSVFFLLNLIGLGLNTLLMWLFVDIAGWFYMFAKIAVAAIVMVWSFVSRKIFLEEKHSAQQTDA